MLAPLELLYVASALCAMPLLWLGWGSLVGASVPPIFVLRSLASPSSPIVSVKWASTFDENFMEHVRVGKSGDLFAISSGWLLKIASDTHTVEWTVPLHDHMDAASSVFTVSDANHMYVAGLRKDSANLLVVMEIGANGSFVWRNNMIRLPAAAATATISTVLHMLDGLYIGGFSSSGGQLAEGFVVKLSALTGARDHTFGLGPDGALFPGHVVRALVAGTYEVDPFVAVLGVSGDGSYMVARLDSGGQAVMQSSYPDYGEARQPSGLIVDDFERIIVVGTRRTAVAGKNSLFVQALSARDGDPLWTTDRADGDYESATLAFGGAEREGSFYVAGYVNQTSLGHLRSRKSVFVWKLDAEEGSERWFWAQEPSRSASTRHAVAYQLVVDHTATGAENASSRCAAERDQVAPASFNSFSLLFCGSHPACVPTISAVEEERAVSALNRFSRLE